MGWKWCVADQQDLKNINKAIRIESQFQLASKSRNKNKANFPIPVAYPHYVTLSPHVTYEVRRESSTMGYPMVTP